MTAAANRQALQLIDRAHRILVVTHVAPDGDAIGSLLAMGQMLMRLGKADVTLACDDPVSQDYGFLPGATEVICRLPSTSPPPLYDLIVVVDCSDIRRGGEVFGGALTDQSGVINIDHHVTNTLFGTVNIVQLDAVATTEALLRLAQDWNVTVDASLSQCLLTGLVTDTLCFRTANVTSSVIKSASDLMEAGADLTLITSNTVNRKPFDAVRYWGRLLQTVCLEDGIVAVYASAVDRRESGSEVSGDASIVTFLNTVQEADIAASFVETDAGQVEVSLRAKPGVDVSGVAYQLGGGGHPAAAGCTIDGPLGATMHRVLRMLREVRGRQCGGSSAPEPAREQVQW